jgi:hypothetical protein
MTNMLRATLEELTRDLPLPTDPAGDALRLAARRRRRRAIGAPVAAMAGVGAVVVIATVALHGRPSLAPVVTPPPTTASSSASVTPAPPAIGPGSVPDRLFVPPKKVLSVLDHPIARAAVLYDTGAAQILVSADGDVVRGLPSAGSGGYFPMGFELSPDGARVAYGWNKADYSSAEAGQVQTELRILTLATGEVQRVPLPGAGLGVLVQQILWSADGRRLIVEAISITSASPDGEGGTIEVVLVDARTGMQSAGPSAGSKELQGWSRDGRRVLAINNNELRVANLDGTPVILAPMGQLADHGQIGEGWPVPAAWSPDERFVAVVNAISTAGHPLNYDDKSDRPFVVRVFSLTSKDAAGNTSEVDVPLGTHVNAAIVGWPDSGQPLVAVTSHDGALEVDALDTASLTVHPVMTAPAAVRAASVQVAIEVLATGGFRKATQPQS